MIKVALIGNGNVSHHLEKAFRNTKEINVTVFNGRDDLAKKITDVDVCLIAVSDAAIVAVATKLMSVNAIVAHTSGSLSIADLPNKHKAVYYPLQTFSKNKSVDFSTVPICIEAKSEADLKTLEVLANSISNAVYKVTSEKRRILHVAAVFANNFSNHLFYITQKICEENDLPFSLLKPLITETIAKLKTVNPIDAQTGPARRHDLITIRKHQKTLANSNYKKLYNQLTQSILDTYGQKL